MQAKKVHRFSVSRFFILFLLILLSANSMSGQDIDVLDDDEPTEVPDSAVEWRIGGGAFTPYFIPALNLMIGIGAVLALFGSIKVYNRWHLGVGNIERSVTNLFGGGLFLLVMSLFLRAAFL